MSDVYRIQMSLGLAGNIAPELRKLLGTMTDIEKKAKSTEKALGTFAAPISRAVAEARRLSAALAGIKTRAGGIERNFGRWGTAAGKSAGELRNVRTTLDGVRTSARTVSSSMGTWSGGIGRANRQLQGTVTALNQASRAAAGINIGDGRAPPGTGGRRRGRGNSFGNGVGFGAGMGTGDAAAGVVGRAGRAGVQYAGEGVREDIRQKNAGITPSEMAVLSAKAMQLSAQYPSISPLAAKEMGRLLIPNVGNAAKAMELLPDYIRAQAAVQTISGPQNAGKETEVLSKFIDNIGQSMDVTTTRALLDGYVKARQLDSEGVKANDYLNFSKTAQSSGKTLSADFYRDVLPSLIMQQGGSRTGTSIATAYQNTVMGRSTKEALIEQQNLGIRQNMSLGTERSGRQVVKKKGEFVDQELYSSNNYEWAKKHLLNKAIEKGFAPPEWANGDFTKEMTDAGRIGVGKMTSSFSSDRTAANLFTSYLTDMPQIEATRGRLRNARGTADVASDQTRDPFIAVNAILTQMKSAFDLITGPAIATGAPMLAQFAAGMASISEAASRSPELLKLGSGAAIAGGAVAVAAVGAKATSAITGALGVNTAKGIGKGILTAGRLGRGGLVAGGLGLGVATAGGTAMREKAEATIAAAKRMTTGKGSPEELAQAEQSSAALRKYLWGVITKPFSGLNDQMPAGGKPQAVIGGPGGTGPAPGSPDAIKQTATAIDAASAAATGAAPNLTSTASGINEVKSAAAGAGGALSSLAGQIRALGNVSVPSAGPAGAGAAPSAAPATPGKSSSYAPPARSTAPATLTANLHMDGRRVAQSVTRHQVAANDTRNGTGGFDSNRLQTPVGFSAPTQA